MKKNICPYLGTNNKCTHKNSNQSNCPYSNLLKCETYNQWLKAKKSLRMAKNDDESIIKRWVEDFKWRFKNE